MAFEVIFMDAGQGDAILLAYPDGSLVLVDCGSKKNKRIVADQITEIFQRRIYSGANRLKALVLTHSDGDHWNLVNDLVIQPGVEVDSVLIGGAITDYGGIAWWLNQQEQALKRATNDRWATITLSRPHHSDDIVPELSYDPMDEEEKVETRILAANVGHETNDMSIVLLVTYRNVGIFLMGDATDVTEDAILESLYWDGSWLEEAVHSSDNRIILKVGHHGSDTSSSERWIQSIMPELAFVSSDTKGFGRAGTSIPRKEILDRILAEGNIEDHPGWNHHYVDYDSGTQEHELEGPTTQGVFTTLYRLKWRTHSTFKSYGTSWYFTVYDDGDIGVDPSCEWPGVLIADPRPPA